MLRQPASKCDTSRAIARHRNPAHNFRHRKDPVNFTDAIRLIIAAAMLAASPATYAERYPSKPVRLIVPYSPGGGSDITARALGQKLTEALGQTFVVDTRPGAASMIGTEIAARAAHDGYTLLLADAAHSINAVVYAKPRYHAIKDFAPVSLIAATPLAFMAHPSFAPGIKELLSMPKAQTEKIAMGTTGPGGAPHMTYESLRTKTGLTLNEVPYKGGGPAMTDAVAGQIPLVLTSLAAGLPYLKSGRLKGLALTAAKRHPLTPDIPTFQEAGAKDFVVTHWYGILAPAGTPREIVQVLDREIAKALAAPDMRERFVALALDAIPGGPEAFLQLLQSEQKRWQDVVAQTREFL